MDASQINSTFDLFPLVESDTTLKKSGAFFIGPCPFCGGTDRFNLTHAANGWRWFCRQCGGEKYHSAIDYYTRRFGCDFKTALTEMGGETARPPAAIRRMPAQPKATLPPADWQANAWRRIGAANADLLRNPGGEVGRYLDGRGLHIGTRGAYSLGATVERDPTTQRERPAVLIPWQDGSIVTCLAFRFVDAEQPNEHKFKTRGASGYPSKILFGIHDLHNIGKTLIVFEGEINAMSVRQAAAGVHGLGVDCVSIGSDNPAALALTAVGRLAALYERLILWMDDPAKIAKIRQAIGGEAQTITSPIEGGRKFDSNQMLQDGLLVEFLRLSLRIAS